mmetsp:Transcript_24134/g.52871  ORF Transcript_24134/g.52871 Transcript_24134/m.52871 type:complete len:116 (-) Transcript_24134:548-895(-)
MEPLQCCVLWANHSFCDPGTYRNNTQLILCDAGTIGIAAAFGGGGVFLRGWKERHAIHWPTTFKAVLDTRIEIIHRSWIFLRDKLRGLPGISSDMVVFRRYNTVDVWARDQIVVV